MLNASIYSYVLIYSYKINHCCTFYQFMSLFGLGRASRMAPSSPLVSITSIFFLPSFWETSFLLCHVSQFFICCLDLCWRILVIQFSSSLLITWPYHLNLASHIILSVIHATTSIFLMTSFLSLSFCETPSCYWLIDWLIDVLFSDKAVSLCIRLQPTEVAAIGVAAQSFLWQ